MAEMTREEAAKNPVDLAIWEFENAIKGTEEDNSEYPNYCIHIDEYKTALKALLWMKGPQPDPKTGLVPCGCGTIAKVRKSQAPYSGYYIVCQNINCICNVGFDRDTSGVPLGYFKTEEEAIKAWNTAMGYTAPPRPGAIVPDAGEMAPNGDEGAEE